MTFRSIVVLTGAGISAESGLGTFRDADGLWTKYDLAEVATPEGFARNPAFVHEFYNARRRNLLGAAPDAAHAALAHLEAQGRARVTIVTQNVDSLHERAGSRSVIHMHGELLKVRCHAAEHVLDWPGDLSVETRCPRCGDAAVGPAGRLGYLRPHVVWFGEMPFAMERIGALLGECDLFVAIGTSGNVYPAAGFVDKVRGIGAAHTVELNLEPSDGASRFAEAIYGPATRVVPAFVERLLQDGASTRPIEEAGTANGAPDGTPANSIFGKSTL
ncbi:MAG: NAD-dependent deacylase [Alphaproteobacteria bacterium]|nr:NAD-dependent deacylase [Alphaproteobacteria bacterium]